MTDRQRVLAYALRCVAALYNNAAAPVFRPDRVMSWDDCLTAHPTRGDSWMFWFNVPCDGGFTTKTISGLWPSRIGQPSCPQ